MARHGTLYQGQWYSWQQKPRGGRAIGLPASAWVNFLENHDQVANTGFGRRLHEHVDGALLRALTALLLLGPSVPMLFQGQEFGSTRPFTYFADHDGELANAVEAGRRQFLTQFIGLAQPAMQERIPRPHDARTFEQCKLLDEERDADSPLRRMHRDLIHLRRTDPVLADLGTATIGIESSAPHHIGRGDSLPCRRQPSSRRRQPCRRPRVADERTVVRAAGRRLAHGLVERGPELRRIRRDPVGAQRPVALASPVGDASRRRGVGLTQNEKPPCRPYAPLRCAS